MKNKKWTYQLKMLFGYTKRKGISDRKLAALLGIHWNTVHYWRKGKNEPSAIARVIVRDFLIKNL